MASGAAAHAVRTCSSAAVVGDLTASSSSSPCSGRCGRGAEGGSGKEVDAARNQRRSKGREGSKGAETFTCARPALPLAGQRRPPEARRDAARAKPTPACVTSTPQQAGRTSSNSSSSPPSSSSSPSSCNSGCLQWQQQQRRQASILLFISLLCTCGWAVQGARRRATLGALSGPAGRVGGRRQAAAGARIGGTCRRRVLAGTGWRQIDSRYTQAA